MEESSSGSARLIHYACTLCHLVLPNSKDRYSVKGRSSFDIEGAIRGLPWQVDIDEKAHVCRQCLARLKKKINLEQTYNKCVSELRELGDCVATLHPLQCSTPVKNRGTINLIVHPTSPIPVQSSSQSSSTTTTRQATNQQMKPTPVSNKTEVKVIS